MAPLLAERDLEPASALEPVCGTSSGVDEDERLPWLLLASSYLFSLRSLELPPMTLLRVRRCATREAC